MELETGILQDICDQIAAEIDAVVTIFGSRGSRCSLLQKGAHQQLP